MSTSPDIRLPCGVTQKPDEEPIAMGCWQQYNDSIDEIKVKTNVTLMKDWVSGSTAWVPVESTISQPTHQPCCGHHADYDCDFTFQPDHVCKADDNSNQWCYEQINDTWFKDCNYSSSTSFPVGNWHNCYSQSNDTMSYGKCRSVGFKNVYASKAWQGIYAYTSEEWGKTAQDEWDWCGDYCGYVANRPTADQTKYRTMTAWATYDVDHGSWCGCTETGDPYTCCCIDGNGNPCAEGSEGCTCAYSCQCYTCPGITHKFWGAAASATSTVDLYGNVTNTCASSSYGASCYGGAAGCDGGPDSCCDTYPDPDACVSANMAILSGISCSDLGLANTNWTNLNGTFGCIVNGCPFGGMGSPRTAELLGPGHWKLTWVIDLNQGICTDGCSWDATPYSYTSDVIEITPTTLDIKHYSLSIPHVDVGQDYCTDTPFCQRYFLSRHRTWAYTPTTFHYTDHLANTDYTPDGGYADTVVHGELSNPHTSQEVYDSIVTLLGTWDFGDEKIYPWREDAAVTMGPYVCYDETVSQPSVGCNCSSSHYYTGVIKGAPGPEGIDRIWNPAHPNYCVCHSNNGFQDCYTMYDDTFGNWSTQCGVPRASQWLDYWHANCMPQGGFVGEGFIWNRISSTACSSAGAAKYIADSTLWACKYAEVIYPKQSFNYARPCAKDRLQISSSTTWCVRTVTDRTLDIEPLGPPTDPFSATEPIVVCGVSGIDDGIYKATGGGGYSITLGDTLASASWLPVTTLMPNCGTGMIGRITWPSMNMGICGRVDILSMTKSSPSSSFVVEFNTPSYLFSNDKVQVVGVKGISGINNVWSVLPSGPTTLTLLGTGGIQGTYKGNGQMYNPFAVDWRWNDTSPKNDFSVLNWEMSFRDVGEFTRLQGEATHSQGLSRACCPPWGHPPTCDEPVYCPPDCNCPQPAMPPQPRYQQAACGLSPEVKTVQCSTACLPFNECQAVAAYFSPNVEHFDKSTEVVASANYGFGFNGMDGTYGVMENWMIKQSMSDPYFIPPPCPCEYDVDFDVYGCLCGMRMDNGSCQPDEVGPPCRKYYAHVDQFEARCEPPTIQNQQAPPLVNGAYIGCLSTPAFNSSTCPPGNVCNAPMSFADYWGASYKDEDGCSPYYLNPYVEIPWTLLATEENCVCAGGRFSSEYVSNGVNEGPTCPVVEPP